MTEHEPKRRFRLGLSTLLWIVVAASCFFAGKYAGKVEPLPDNQLTISAGKSTTVITDFDVPEMVINDPNICMLKPTAPNRFELTALEPGKTRITLTKMEGGEVEYMIVVPEEAFD